MAERNDLKQYIVALLAEELEIPETEIAEEMNLIEDLGLRSLEIVSLVTDIEDHFQVSVEDTEIQNLASVKDIIDNLLNKLNSNRN